MKPLFHPELVNGPFGDPALYVECLFQHRALMFDLGEVPTLAPRKILRVSDVFVSHTHMDHFMGFDRLLRICLGRDKTLRLVGPPGFIDQLEHKLASYTWNLVENYGAAFTVEATEVRTDGTSATARFRCRAAFRREPIGEGALTGGVVLDEKAFRVRTAVLDHKIPCLAYTLEEKLHVNVWKNRLEEMGLPTGPWLQELKRAVLAGESDDTVIRAWWREESGAVGERHLRLGEIRDAALRLGRGQKVTYVVDVVFHQDNAQQILDLARGSDILYIEATFLQEDARHAAEKYHLTAHQAGTLARLAGVERMVPFHFSARYSDSEDRLREEAQRAFAA
jgi:ribonuclease Z